MPRGIRLDWKAARRLWWPRWPATGQPGRAWRGVRVAGCSGASNGLCLALPWPGSDSGCAKSNPGLDRAGRLPCCAGLVGSLWRGRSHAGAMPEPGRRGTLPARCRCGRCPALPSSQPFRLRINKLRSDNWRGAGKTVLSRHQAPRRPTRSLDAAAFRVPGTAEIHRAVRPNRLLPRVEFASTRLNHSIHSSSCAAGSTAPPGRRREGRRRPRHWLRRRA